VAKSGVGRLKFGVRMLNLELGCYIWSWKLNLEVAKLVSVPVPPFETRKYPESNAVRHNFYLSIFLICTSESNFVLINRSSETYTSYCTVVWRWHLNC
jgi:hypothetical protein